MGKPASSAYAATPGGQGYRAGAAAWALAVLLIAWIGLPGEVRADTIVLKSGEAIEGSIIDATRNTVVIRRAIGGMRQLRLQDIEEVRIDLARGEEVTGQILSWVEGVHQIRSGDEVVRIGDGRVLSRAPVETVTAQPARTPPLRPEETQPVDMAAAPRVAQETAAQETDAEETAPVEAAMSATTAEEAPQEAATEEASAATAAEDTDAEATDAEETAPVEAAMSATTAEEALQEAATEEEASAATVAEDTDAEATAAEATAPEEAVAEPSVAVPSITAEIPPQQAESDGRVVAVKASVNRAAAGAPGMVFKIELSQPAEQTVVLIYGTVDGTAKAGRDYEPREGVVSLAPGTTTAEVRVPLLEPARPQRDAKFELFLTADPTVAEVVDQRITATIRGDN